MEDAVGSGWSQLSIDYLTTKFAEYLVTVGSSYRPLPDKIKDRRGITNMENDDQECFKYAVTRGMYPVTKNGERVSKTLRKQTERLNWDGINFPTSFHDIDIFENINKISVMVHGWNENEERIEYLRMPNTKHARAVRLFHYDGHYSVITSMSAFTRKDFKNNTHHFCSYCPFNHRKEEAVKTHMEDCAIDELTEVKMPKEGECVMFKNWDHTVFKPFVIIADCESRLDKVNIEKGKNTTQTQVHRTAGYCYRLISRVDPSESVTVQYTAKTNEEDVSLHSSGACIR